jgi:O-antigen/teichoic acid export membrane protein/thiamine kinase-like enzyme
VEKGAAVTFAHSSVERKTMPMLRKIAEFPMIKSLRSSPLLLNGYSLIASAGLTSVLGVVFWMIATRLFTPEEVGFGAALISSMTTIGYFAQMNLGSVLNRFLPTSGSGKSALVLKAYIAAAALAALSATVFALGIGRFAPPLQVLGEHSAAVFWFVAATVLWTIFALQDAVLAGLRRAVIVPMENALYSSAKIVFLAAFAFLVLPVPGGIYFAWTVPLIPAVAIVSVIIFRNASLTSSQGAAPDLKTIFRFVGWDYSGSLAMAAAFGLAPLIVLSVSGEAANAVYHIAWTVTYSIYLIGRSMSISLVTEGASNRPRLRKLVSDTVSHTMPLVIAAVLLVVIAAPLLMRLFGPVYEQDGTGILRVLVLSCIPWAATTIFIASARVAGHTHHVAVVQLATLLVFAVAAALLAPGLGALGIAIAWLSAHTFVFAGLIASHLYAKGVISAGEWALTIVSSAGQTVTAAINILNIHGNKKNSNSNDAALERVTHESIDGLEPHTVTGSLSDVSVVLFQERNEQHALTGSRAKVVLKTTSSPKGAESLKRNSAALNELKNDKHLENMLHLFPTVIAAQTGPDMAWSLETAVPGEDGRFFLQSIDNSEAALGAAITAISDLHKRTAKLQAIDESWTDQWIDEPLKSLEGLASAFLSEDQRQHELKQLREQICKSLMGRRMQVGRCHGDFSPGNILFSTGSQVPDGIAVSGLIDWDNSSESAPALFDIFHLLLAVRTQTTGEELGLVVRRVLKDGWSAEERELIDLTKSETTEKHVGDRTFERSMLLLTWLNHLAANLNKSQRYAKSHFWVAANFDWVLITLKRDGFLET